MKTKAQIEQKIADYNRIANKNDSIAAKFDIRSLEFDYWTKIADKYRNLVKHLEWVLE